MADIAANARKDTLDKDLDKLVHVEEAATFVARGLVGPGLAFLFLALTALIVSFFVLGEPGAVVIVAAAAIGGYMALNIGANDVANNVGPAVGSKALTLGGALLIAAFFESAGALIAGGDVVSTVAGGIVSPDAVPDSGTFIRLMMAALLSSALWINLATWLGAPVSTTHSIVGGVVGSGIAAAGFSAVDWGMMANIVASWVVSPVMGGVVAALFLGFIKARVIYQDDKIRAARLWVPLLIGIMGGAFAAYLASKGLRRVVSLSGSEIALLGFGCFVAVWGLSHVGVKRQSQHMDNRNQSLRRLFHLPLICSAALLSFAHGANDVANAVGPLAAIVQATQSHGDGAIAIPLWVMVIGAFGISLGLVLFGPKLIRMVGEQITKLNPMRAFCVALAAAITVIIASALGLPVSSTHTAVGAIFGVGFFREWYTARSPRRRAYLERKAARLRSERLANGGAAIGDADADESGEDGGDDLESAGPPESREEAQRRKLVRRAHVTTIVAAWVTTVPAAALLSAVLFVLLQAFA